MAKILGFIVSPRKMGNSELAVKHALMYLQQKGHDVSLLRLSDFNVLQCDACMKCILNTKDCHLHDDMNLLVETLMSFDCLVLGSPAYSLGPPAIFKTVLDRIFEIGNTIKKKNTSDKNRFAIALAVESLEPYLGPFTIPNLTFFSNLIGFKMCAATKLNAAAFGEVLIRDGYLEKIEKCASFLDIYLKQPQEFKKLQLIGQEEEIYCPICSAQYFQLLKADLSQIRCPNCGCTGILMRAEVEWNESTNFLNDKHSGQHHENVDKNNIRWREKILEIISIRKNYLDKNLNLTWIEPEGRLR